MNTAAETGYRKALRQWYAIYTRSRHEKDVSDEYTELSLEHYLPLVSRDQRWRDRQRKVDFPLFPVYLFAHECFLGKEGWEKRVQILHAKGVVRILCDQEGTPIPVPDQEIFNIRTVLEKNMKVDPYQYEFYEGQPLRIRKGPLAGVEGHLLQRKGVQQLILQVHLLHQAVAVTLLASDVEAMG